MGDLFVNNNAKNEYKYYRYWYEELTDSMISKMLLINECIQRKARGTSELCRRIECHKVGIYNSTKVYLNIPMAFDIETTTLQKEYMKGKKLRRDGVAVMYVWQMAIGKNVVMGRKWEEFICLLNRIKKLLKPLETYRAIIFVHNLGYEFQFMRNWLDINNAEMNFFKEQRRPLVVTHSEFFEFRDSMAITNSTLSKLAKDYTNTQKCVGDLDYNIIRNNETPLTLEEEGYCHNDVLILSEFYEWYWRECIIKLNKAVMTGTSILLTEVKEEYSKSGFNKYLKAKKPKTEEDYLYAVNWIFRGGYTHGNVVFMNQIFNEYDRILGVDITSSYPATMLTKYFPGEWNDYKFTTIDEFNNLCENFCVIFEAQFFGIKSTTHHTLESKSKCIFLTDDAEIDNGRVRQAESMVVALTELDWQSYKEFYSWSNVIISKIRYAKRMPLAKYLVNTMLKYYKLKAVLKSEGKPYAIEKAKVNTFYGMCVKKLNADGIQYENGEWKKVDAQSFEKQMKKTCLSTYDGIYITAHSRRKLLDLVYKFEQYGYDVLYCDTDSIKVLDADKGAIAIIEAENTKILKEVKNSLKYYNKGYDKEYLDLGEWDIEYKIGDVRYFKMLGSKRYCISTYIDNKWHHNQTIAGAPKNILFRDCNTEEDIVNVYNSFCDDLVIPRCKKTAMYIDEPTTVDVNGVVQRELSSIALVDCDFSLSLVDTFLDLISTMENLQGETRERRIYG